MDALQGFACPKSTWYWNPDEKVGEEGTMMMDCDTEWIPMNCNNKNRNANQQTKQQQHRHRSRQPALKKRNAQPSPIRPYIWFALFAPETVGSPPRLVYGTTWLRNLRGEAKTHQAIRSIHRKITTINHEKIHNNKGVNHHHQPLIFMTVWLVTTMKYNPWIYFLGFLSPTNDQLLRLTPTLRVALLMPLRFWFQGGGYHTASARVHLGDPTGCHWSVTMVNHQRWVIQFINGIYIIYLTYNL